MGLLIDQFCDAIREWSRRTGERESAITWNVMFWIGARSGIEPVGKTDPQSLPKERQRTATLGEIMGHFTVDQVKEWLEFLVYRGLFYEPFIVPALVRAVHDEFEGYAEDYAKGIATRRQHKEKLEEIAADPERLADYVRRLNAIASEEKLSSRLGLERGPVTEADIYSMIATMTKMSTPSLEDQRRNRMYFDVWQELTAPILDSENLERAREEFHDRFREA